MFQNEYRHASSIIGVYNANFNIVDGYESKKSNEENTLTHLFSKYKVVVIDTDG